MILSEFDRLYSPCQNLREWQAFLELAEAYLRNRGVERPLVVEVGSFLMQQRPYYRKLLDAEHIAVDIATNKVMPDVVGDSRDLATLSALRALLGDRRPDIVFIDADHSYAATKSDFEMYGPLAKHIVAIHDIDNHWVDVNKFWRELVHADKADCRRTYITICENRGFPPHMGIGVVLKGIADR